MKSVTTRSWAFILMSSMLTTAALASPGIETQRVDAASSPAAEWSGSASEQAELGKAFARRWAFWTVMTKEKLRTAMALGDWDAWQATGVTDVLSSDELETLRQSMTPELIRAFETIEAPMEKLWIRPAVKVDGNLECYSLDVVGKLVGIGLDAAEDGWQMTTSETPLQWSLAAEERPAEMVWKGSAEERHAMQEAFARRWVFWTMATKGDLRQAFAEGDWQAWKPTGLTEYLSEDVLNAMREQVEPQHLAALEVVDETMNSLWIFPEGRGSQHCYSKNVVRQMVDDTLDMVERDWRLADS